jgi:hypothetical protein
VGLLWYFLLALGFLVMVVMSVPDDDTAPAPPPDAPSASVPGTQPPPNRLP